MRAKTAFITGGAGGLGSTTASFLAGKGWQIFAADMNREGLEQFKQAQGITPVFIDVARQDSIDEALAMVSNRADGLDAVINMAGILIVGSMAELPVEKIQHILEVNFLGTYRVNKTFLPLILKNRGRVINISSETGWQTAAPFNGPYALTKYALEAYSDALRRELGLLGIRVVKIQPGPFKSGMTASVEEVFRIAEEDSTLFKNNIARGRGYTSSVYKKAHDPVILARVIHKALTDSRPKFAYSVKPDKGRSFLEKLPVRWADWVLKKALL